MNADRRRGQTGGCFTWERARFAVALGCVVLVGCLMLAGCAQDGGTVPSEPTGTTESTAAKTPDAPAESDEAPAESDEAPDSDAPSSSTGSSTGAEAAASGSGLRGIYGIPAYPGMQALPGEVDFDWPDIERKKQRFAEWEYYSSEDAYTVIAEYYRDQMPGEPWNKTEIAWVDIDEGMLGLWHDPESGMWIRVWAVPRPDAGGGSWIIIAVDILGLAGC